MFKVNNTNVISSSGVKSMQYIYWHSPTQARPEVNSPEAFGMPYPSPEQGGLLPWNLKELIVKEFMWD